MTRRLLLLTAVTLSLLFSGVIIDSPAPAAGAAMLPKPASAPAGVDAPRFDVYFGEGVVQVRIRACGTCRTDVSIRLELAGFAADLITR